MLKQDLLIEIGTEELPPKALPALSAAFLDSMSAQLKKAGLAFDGIVPYATPRRLALLVQQLAVRQPDQNIVKTGPAVQAAFAADGTPTKAAEGFARSCGVSVAELQQRQDGTVLKLAFETVQAGATTAELIPVFVKQALDQLPVPKRMRWGSSRNEFVRPVHWIVLLFGDKVIDAEILGIQSGNKTRGHRFMHPGELVLASPAEYAEVLRSPGFVIASFDERRADVRKQVEEEGRKHNAHAIIDDDLLDEVTALVEWPVALTGSFDKAFLNVPKEALISSMKEHQKCFHLLNKEGGILPNFITLSNLVSSDPGKVIAGNEKVIRPRLADAAFFYNQDKKSKLEDRIPKLGTVVFQQELGTVYDKSQRVARLATAIAEQLGTNAGYARRAADIGKCDLLTSMVYEFAELQGIMGYYYAIQDGEPEEVARALNEQYMPRFAGDALPETSTGMVLALAERLDTITGLFGIGQPPTGSKDPFALRRAALGILRIVIEKNLPLDLAPCIAHAIGGFNALSNTANLDNIVQDFIFERLRAWYADLGISADVFQSVAAVRPTRPLDFDARIKAVKHFIALPQAQALAAANKRVSNILAKSESAILPAFKAELAQEPAEQALAGQLAVLLTEVSPALRAGNYTAALSAMASLQAPVDAFFDTVMVNVEDTALRNNRLALLHQLRNLFLQVADISHIQHG
jgi:glycyl-tRNA synthetase beta chain